MMRSIPLGDRDTDRNGDKLNRRNDGKESDIEGAMAKLLPGGLRKDELLRDPATGENQQKQGALQRTRMIERETPDAVQTHEPAFQVRTIEEWEAAPMAPTQPSLGMKRP